MQLGLFPKQLVSGKQKVEHVVLYNCRVELSVMDEYRSNRTGAGQFQRGQFIIDLGNDGGIDSISETDLTDVEGSSRLNQQINLTSLLTLRFPLKPGTSKEHGVPGDVQTVEDNIEILQYEAFELQPHHGVPVFELFEGRPFETPFHDLLTMRFNVTKVKPQVIVRQSIAYPACLRTG